MSRGAAATYDLTLNPRPTIVSRPRGRELEPILLVDDLLANAAALIEYACWEVAFTPAGNPDGGYPGIRAPAPLNYVEAVARGLTPIIRQVFGLGNVTLANAECSFSVTTMPPAQLTLQQRTPHIDTVYPMQFALLHYLCAPEFGGTAFYRHRATGFETIGADREATYDAAREAELARRAPPAGYVGDSDGYYELLGACDARFNRMAIYRSCLLHSAHVTPGIDLPADPRRGRLTANIFLNFKAQ